MAKNLTIKLDTSQYQEPTQQQLKDAKDFILKRVDAANEMRNVAGDMIIDAAAAVAAIAFWHDISGEDFVFDSEVDSEMMSEVGAVMNDLEEELYLLLEEKATAPAKDNGTKLLLIGLLLALGHKNLGIRGTLHQYLWRTLRQTEAIIAAAKSQGKSQAETIALVRSGIANPMTVQILNSAYKTAGQYRAPFINSRGRATYSDGSPNVQGVPVSGLQAVQNVVGNAIDILWTRYDLLQMKEVGAIGYYQFRGSNYPCNVCDDEVGFHEFGDLLNDDYPHPHCCCGRIPIYRKEEIESY